MSQTSRSLGVYIHIPFCRRRCVYCDFLSTGGAHSVPDTYSEDVLKEWSLWTERLLRDHYQVQSIYVGGGTPSLLDPVQVRRFIDAIQSAVPTAPGCEVTLEGNPDSLDDDRIRQFAQAGVNRLSVGVQSFSDPALRQLGRLHSAAQAERVLVDAHSGPIRNLSLDLMYGLPSSGRAEEIASLRHAIKLSPEHISWYNLTVAAGTPLARSVEKGEVVMPDDDAILETMREGWALLESEGYEHYEISNFARPGFASLHNLAYWLFTDYVGLGLGSSGFVDGRRWTNVDQFEAYDAAIQQRRFPVAYEEHLEGRRREGEYAMLRLRLPLEGLKFAAFQELFQEDVRVVFAGVLAQLLADDLIAVSEDRVTCTQRGLELNNVVAEAFI